MSQADHLQLIDLLDRLRSAFPDLVYPDWFEFHDLPCVVFESVFADAIVAAVLAGDDTTPGFLNRAFSFLEELLPPPPGEAGTHAVCTWIVETIQADEAVRERARARMGPESRRFGDTVAKGWIRRSPPDGGWPWVRPTGAHWPDVGRAGAGSPFDRMTNPHPKPWGERDPTETDATDPALRDAILHIYRRDRTDLAGGAAGRMRASLIEEGQYGWALLLKLQDRREQLERIVPKLNATDRAVCDWIASDLARAMPEAREGEEQAAMRDALGKVEDAFPELVSAEWVGDRDLPYIVCESIFAAAIKSALRNAEHDEAFLSRALGLLEDILRVGEPAVFDLVTVAVLEYIHSVSDQDVHLIESARQRMGPLTRYYSGRALESLGRSATPPYQRTEPA